MSAKYEYVIWLEIHVKLNSPNKLFCRCKNEQEFDNVWPNTNICPVCTWQPWALPVLNQEPLEKAILLWHALDCKIETFSKFDRKSYFYPDSPLSYQITQLSYPTNGLWHVDFWVNNYEESRTIRVERAHIEADAGKTVHEWWKWIVDFNRAVTPLVEIVTFPDFKSDEEVVEFLKELQRRIRINNIWFADLEKWQMRCDVNISTRLIWESKLGTKVEVKNMNSFSAIKRAIASEFERHIEILEAGKSVEQETRGWDDESGTSYTMRSKEDSLDYRYFPEPDLPPLVLEQSFIDSIAKLKKPSSYSRVKAYKEYGFNKEYIHWVIQDSQVNDYFEEIVSAWFDPKTVAKWLVWSILRLLNDKGSTISDLKFSADDFKQLLRLINDWLINDAQAKQVLFEMYDTWKNPKTIADEKGFKPVESGFLEWIVKEILAENPKALEDLKNWEMKAVGFLVWQAMKKSQWKWDPKIFKELFEKA